MKKELSALILAAATLTTAHAANLMTNGDFEDPLLGNGWSSTPVVGFAPISVYHTCCTIYGSYPYGDNAAFFGWGDKQGGAIWQDISTSAGQTYQLDFLYGAVAQANPQSLNVSIWSNTTQLAALNVGATGTYNLANLVTPRQLTFTAQSNLTRVLFSDTSTITNSTDGVLDNVSVAAVPEAQTYLTLLAGLGLLGVYAKRGKNKAIA